MPAITKRPDPNYPLRDFTQPASGQTVQVVSLRDEHGKWIAQLVADSKFRAYGPTRKAAETSLLDKLAQVEEDEADIAVMKQRQNEPLLSLDQVMKKHGRR
ncbi:MAG: hypothetical protein FJW32_08120 [Acidobacteria bacterium]|nr:hypothetical protein [Acidobacteriota bacterium]